jgi:hydroxypyruvate isomerase
MPKFCANLTWLYRIAVHQTLCCHKEAGFDAVEVSVFLRCVNARDVVNELARYDLKMALNCHRQLCRRDQGFAADAGVRGPLSARFKQALRYARRASQHLHVLCLGMRKGLRPRLLIENLLGCC